MFWHVFIYRLKCLLRDRPTVFWTLIFPLVMATLFHFAFGHLTSDFEGFQPIPVAVIDNAALQGNPHLQEMLESLAEPGQRQYLELALLPEADALIRLEEGKISGIIEAGNPPSLIVKRRGPNQTILKSILDTYTQTTQTITRLAVDNFRNIDGLLEAAQGNLVFTEQISLSRARPDTNLGFFYALIAMTCMYASYWGIRNSLHLQADQSPQGARRSIAPTHKVRIVLSDTLAALVISFAEVLLFLAYLRFALGIGFGGEIGPILLLTLVGCFCGVSLGNVVGTLVRGQENYKFGILVIVNMVASFLAGLMWVGIKDIVSQKAPILAFLNPAALIADSFYSLYIYDTYQRFALNLSVLAVISLALSLISFMHLRREKYASI